MNNSKQNTILVPTDFTKVAGCALEHSKEIAQLFNLEIYLLHVVDIRTTYAEKEKIKNKLKHIADSNSDQSNIHISYIVKEGNIYDGITDTAASISAELIVMGIHGKYGEQDILGSFAYSVIRNSNVPVMVVKECNSNISDNNIVVPVDYTKNSETKADIAIKYAGKFNSPVCVAGDVFVKSSDTKDDLPEINKQTFLKNIADKIKNEGIKVETGIVIKTKTILVPTDFTPDAEKALEHAIQIAKSFDRKICLLHVIGVNATDEEKERAENNLKLISQSNSEESGIKITYHIKEGSIFDVINATVSELSATLIVMGVHGKKDIRNLPKGFAANVISTSSAPVMAVKKNHTSISNNTIAVHIDFCYESINKVNKAISIARYFNCPIHVIGVKHFDSKSQNAEKEDLKKRVTEYLENAAIKYSAEILAKPKTILVPVDFSDVADHAIDHATQIAELFSHKIILLHVTEESISASEKRKVEAELENISEQKKKTTSVDISYIIKPGNIFSIISKTAIEVSAEFIVMGVHGKKGLQHILGSNAYKIITNSKTPVIVVKNKYPTNGYKNVVVPIDFIDESSFEINSAIKFAKFFDLTLHVLGVLKSESKANKIHNEVVLSNLKEHIENAGLNAKTDTLIRSGNDFDEELLDYSKKTGADLLMIVANKEGKLTEILGKNIAEKIVDKAEIPVFTIIPEKNYDEVPKDNYNFGTFIDPLGLTKR